MEFKGSRNINCSIIIQLCRLSRKMANSLLTVRNINHKYIVVERRGNMKKKYTKPLVVSDKKNIKSENQKPLYLADGRWCCRVASATC